jgi:hypothetical protein
MLSEKKEQAAPRSRFSSHTPIAKYQKRMQPPPIDIRMACMISITTYRFSKPDYDEY